LESIDDKFYTFKNLIMNVINEVAPLKTIRVKRDNLPWVDNEMRDLFSKRDALHTVATSYNDKSHQIWDLYRDLRNFCRSTLRQKMRSFFVEKTTKEFTTSKDFWKFYNKFVIKTKKSKDAQIISNIIDPISKSPVSESAEVANAFNEFFTNINGDSNLTLDASKDFINEKFRPYKQNNLLNTSSFSFEKFTEEKVIEAIKSLDSSSSCGITEVPVSVIKNSAEVLAPFLTSIFNECITSGKIPKDLKCAIAFPLFKKGDSSLCDNYRRISVLSPFPRENS
jgi:hypothetical protein